MEQNPAAIYCRISQDRTGGRAGVERQEQDCRQLAERLGFTVVEVFTDNDMSAYSGKPRRRYLAMLEAVDAGRFGAVIAWHPDRLHRSPVELEDYISRTEAVEVPTHTVTAGHWDLSTPSGRLNARNLGNFARFESEHKSERVRRAMRQGLEAGRFMGGVYPFGWERGSNGEHVIVEREAATVREMTARFLAGESIGSLVRWANATGIKTRTGKEWKHTPLRQLLQRPRNAGLAAYDGEVIGASQFPALVSEDDWRAVVATLADPDRLTQSSARVKYLLSGVGRCGVCGERLRTGRVDNRRGVRRTIYKCAGPDPKGHPHRSQEPIDAYVEAVMVARLERDDVTDLFAVDNTSEVDALRAERSSVRGRAESLALEFAAGNITAAQMGTASKRLQEREAELTDRLAGLVATSPLGDMVRMDVPPAEWWNGLSVEKRRALVDALCDVFVDPVGRGRAREFHPDTVRIEWKGAA